MKQIHTQSTARASLRSSALFFCSPSVQVLPLFRVFAVLVLCFICIQLNDSGVYATTIGLTPGDIVVETALPGGSARVPFMFITDSITPVTITVDDVQESIASSWISYEPSLEFIQVSQSKPYQGVALIQIPPQVPLGEYIALKKISVVRPLAPSDGETQAQVSVSLIQKINITVIGDEIALCEVISVTTPDTAQVGDKTTAIFTLKNTGNVRIEPSALVELTSPSGDVVVSAQDSLVLEPTQQAQLVVGYTIPLQADQYVFSSRVPFCEYAGKPFQIIVRQVGELTTKGTLVSVVSPVRTNVSVPVVAVAQFLNEGEKAVTARFVGSVIQTQTNSSRSFSTDSVVVYPGDSYDFAYEFDARSSGRFSIEGVVEYDGKQTPKKSTIVTVLPSSSGALSLNVFLLFGLFIIIVLLLVLVVTKHAKR
jgi:hypothetical protein